MATSKTYHYFVNYEDKDDLSTEFVDVLIRKTGEWKFFCSKEKLGVTKFDQLNENERNGFVAIDVISLYQTDVTKFFRQNVLLRSLKNKKPIIPICLQGANSDYYDVINTLEFTTKDDWDDPKIWERVKNALEDKFSPDTSNSADTKSANGIKDLANNDVTKGELLYIKSGFITDKWCCEFAKRVVDIWWKLAIRLGLNPCDISEIEKNNVGNVCEMARGMLMRWRQSSHTDAEHEQVSVLYQCLAAEKLNDLANEIHCTYKDTRGDSSKIVTSIPTVDKTISNDIFVLELSERLPVWKDVVLMLGVDDRKVQTLDNDYQGAHRRAFQALLLWRSEHGDKNDELNMNEIVCVLQQEGQIDIVEWITDKTCLDEACSEVSRKTPAIQTECERICEELKRQDGVKDVWAAYAYTKGVAVSEDKITFIVMRDNTDRSFDCKGYRCHIRLSGTISEECEAENAEIRKQELIDKAPLDVIMARINETRESEKLMQRHKRLLRITASLVRSIGFKSKTPVMASEGCIALYVSVKGFIPLDEKPFPVMISGYPVDVREGVMF